MRRKLGVLVVGAVLVAIGIASGWYAARQGLTEQPEPHLDEEHGVLSAQALENLGVTIGPAELSDFVRTAKVQGTVVDAPLNEVPLSAPLGGIVRALHTEPGRVVRAGEPVVTIVRSPIPRPALALTADILTPVSENLHESISRLRTAAAQRAIVERELERVRRFTETGTSEGLPVLPRKQVIDLEYDLARATQEQENAERELQRHGLGPDEIEAVRAGATPPGNQRLWKRALEENGLWGGPEEAILAALPEEARARPWSIAAIGELSAAGLATPELAAAMREVPDLGRSFVEVAALLLEGNTVEKVRLLAGVGALEPVIELRAPARAPDWDVAAIAVQPGQRVEAGATVARLHDARRMWLLLEPLGDELQHVTNALEKQTPLRAQPLVTGTGPELDGLVVDRLETLAGQAQRGALAVVHVGNEPVAGARPDTRSWRLRVGLRYLALVPVATLEQRIVLPASAVTSAGPERIVFLRDGESFAAQPVHVEYEDDDVVVIANDGAVFPGDKVVKTGAFALGLALQRGEGAADPHAGHQH